MRTKEELKEKRYDLEKKIPHTKINTNQWFCSSYLNGSRTRRKNMKKIIKNKLLELQEEKVDVLARKIKEVYKEQEKTVPVLMNFKTGILEVSNGKIELEIIKENKLYKIGKIKEKRKSSEEGYIDELLERYGRNK